MSRPTQGDERIAFVASPIPEAQEARERLVRRYRNADPATADAIVALGGDGLMLQTPHRFMHSRKPIYGMHPRPGGFLIDDFAEEQLHERPKGAEDTGIHP